MAFIAAIIGAIASAASTVAGVATAVAGAVASTVGEVAGAVASVSTAVVGEVTSAAAQTISALGSGAGDLFAFLNSAIQDAGKVETAVITPIAHYVDEVTSFVNNINDNIVKPITDSVLVTYNAITNLTTELHADIHGGLKGILAIPDALAGALTSIDAQLGRAMQELGLANKEVVSSVLLPGMSGIFSEPLGNIAAAAAGLGGAKLNLLSQIGQIQLSNCLDSSVFETKIEQATKALQGNEGFVGEVGKMLMTIFWVLPYLAQSVRNDIECFGQTVNAKNPVGLLGLDQIIRALYRGILSLPEATTEAGKVGLSADRLKVLQENQAWLPNPSEALEMFYRAVITEDQLDAVLAKQALSLSDVAALRTIFIAPLNPREYLAQFWRMQAAQANFLPASLGSTVPGVITDLYPAARLSPEQAKLDWLAHWKVPGMEWWFTAWARGLRTQEEFRLAAQQENIPLDVIDDLIPVFYQTIQLWMIPDMFATGILSDADALAYLKYIGMGPQDSDLIMKYGAAKRKAPAGAAAAELMKLSVATAGSMYTDGIIDSAVYLEVLIAHGYSTEAAQLTLQLEDQKNTLVQRKDYVTGLVDAVKVGAMSEQAALADLYAKGYTDAEVYAAQIKMGKAKVAKFKTPTEAQLDALRKAGAIGYDTWAAGYSTLGWSESWIQIFDCFGGSKGEWAPNPNTDCASITAIS